MNYRKRAFFAAAGLLGSLAMPAGLFAGGDQGDAQITILQTTDLHHHANGSDHVGFDVNPKTATSSTGSYARIAAYVNYVRSTAGHPVVLVDSGDWTMGTLYDLTLATRPLALYFLDYMRYDCVTLGNHEFDFTSKGLAQILGLAQSTNGFHTPIVASNMNLGGSIDLAPFVGDGKAIQTTRVQTLSNGIKVGYIGLMGEAAAASAPASAPVSFSPLSTDYDAIQALVDELRNSGANVVIALSHSGTDSTGTSGEDVALAQHVTGLDVIASGHTHTPLSSNHVVSNGTWNTQIIDAGAYGTNVSRVDLTYHASTQTTTLDSFGNPAMTDSSLAAINPGITPDGATTYLVAGTDQQLNTALGTLLAQTFPDYNPSSLATGIYHPVGSAAQDMVSNDTDTPPAPNGLGDLAADAVRTVPNAIIARTLTAAGGNPATVPGYDFTPFQLGLVPTGFLRGKLPTGVQLSFADIYDTLPLGFSPDTSQALPVGSPLLSAYLELADVKKLCALQLVAQSNLAPGDYYLNFSGLRYSLKPAESYLYFKYATAAGVLQTISQEAAAGSFPAQLALLSLFSLASDGGAAVLAAYDNDNPYAGAIVTLNDQNPTLSQIFANLAVLGQVASAAEADRAAGTNTLTTLIVSNAVAAIDTVSAFAPADGLNEGPATDLTGSARVRLAADLSAFLILGSVQTQFGTTITPYKSATGSATLSAADVPGLLANRINQAAGNAGVQELKDWMALLSYLGTSLQGIIKSDYASNANFTQFGQFGAAVQNRNTSYPLASIAQLLSTVTSLQGAPQCASNVIPAIATVTNAAYGADLSATGVIAVWGTGFSAGGGNSIQLTRAGSTDSVTLNVNSGQLFWDLSPNQINTALAGRVTAGQWTLTVKNACGAASPGFAITIQ